LVIAIAPIYVFHILYEFLNDGVFLGLIGIALTTIGLGLHYLLIYRRLTNKFDEMINFLKRITLSQIDEKITVLQRYPAQIQRLVQQPQPVTDQMINSIASDITAIARLRKDISDEQKITINETVLKLVHAMQNNHLDSARIEADIRLLSHD
jgi:predicted PurR-regulated permease PerM